MHCEEKIQHSVGNESKDPLSSFNTFNVNVLNVRRRHTLNIVAACLTKQTRTASLYSCSPKVSTTAKQRRHAYILKKEHDHITGWDLYFLLAVSLCLHFEF